MSGGAEAAEFVIQQVKKAIDSNTFDVGGVRELLLSIDKKMTAAKQFGETTAVIAAVTNEEITGASVGDSGAWMISQSGVENLTAQQYRKPFLGSGCAIPINFERPKLQGTLLLASDGLLKYTGAEQIAATALLPDLKQATEKLIELVRYPSGSLPDDVSVILVREG